MKEPSICLRCGGIFYEIQADGTKYVHECPPLREPEPLLQQAKTAAETMLEKIKEIVLG